MPFPAGDDDRHNSGPMRRGGGRMVNNRPPGPNVRWNSSGRLSPPRGGGGRPGGGRFPDATGAAVMGPREAVQGRSLKSYEDLDAAGGSVGELNY
ncbi:hypothetical protein LTS18_009752 [Coniosporium uncinatum]|uniref:Uncharacterized protein n=1 Tax=Coniosporium uncinatum TaxID=93489 RepID=A0ACC3D0G4_9PEZI|nr:hypothetical protein LTS18_009752 [Coniosporium uncinatum]